jgi:3-deoxy-manno-octulosonate cytidylyltransferase (CMP-KDO synthetase)
MNLPPPTVLAVIPARYASTRFPGKPLHLLAGKTMIERVYRQVQQATLVTHLLVATDSPQIATHVQLFGGNVSISTQPHKTGTDRCLEAAATSSIRPDILINIQGDEPLVNPQQIDELLAFMIAHPQVPIGTLVQQNNNPETIFNPNTVKVVVNHNHQALYFSRHPIPYLRDTPIQHWTEQHTYYQHIGMYAFRQHILPILQNLPETTLEKAESLEQLRWLQHGYSIGVAHSAFQSAMSVDTPEDALKVTAILLQNNL